MDAIRIERRGDEFPGVVGRLGACRERFHGEAAR
jgi:hypothetical protein